MSVLHAPRLSDRIVAENPVVLFSIDPVAAVAKFKDPTASAAAALIPRRKYLAIVEMIVNVDWNKPPTRQPLAYKFHFAARHVSEPASACLALAPGPYLRAPILPSPPLPWSDCYVFTMNGFSARITAIHLTDPASICTVTDAEMERIIVAWVEDLEAQRAAAPPPTPHDGDEGPSVPDSQGSSIVLGSDAGHSGISALLYHDAAPQADSRDSEHAASKASNSSSGSSEESDGDSTRSSEEEEDDFDIHLYGEIWLELSGEEELGTFDEWIDASDRLHEIKEAARRRAMLAELADQPETTKWAEDVASAGATNQQQVAEPPSGYVAPSAADDNLVVPEDAIEHKFEREANAAVTNEPASKPNADSQQDYAQRGPEQTTAATVALPPPAPPHLTRFRRAVDYFGKRLKRATTSVSGRVKNFSRRRSPK